MDFFSCKICEETYDEVLRVPRILSECGHTICEDCAIQILNGIEVLCPFDRVISRARDGNINNLKKNYSILEGMEDQKNNRTFSVSRNSGDEQTNSHETEKSLGICCDEDETHLAVFHCNDCKMNFCEKCSKSSHAFKAFAHHDIVKVSEKSESLLFCPCHPYEKAESYCRQWDCEIENKVMCSKCYSSVHEDHYHVSIDAIYDDKKKETQELLVRARSQIKHYKSCIEMIGDVEDAEHDLDLIDSSDAFDQKMKKYNEMLESWRKQYAQLVTSYQDRRSDRLNDKKKYILKMKEAENLEHHCAFAIQNDKAALFEKLVDIKRMGKELNDVEEGLPSKLIGLKSAIDIFNASVSFLGGIDEKANVKNIIFVEICENLDLASIGSNGLKIDEGMYYFEDKQNNPCLIKTIWESCNSEQKFENTTFIFFSSYEINRYFQTIFEINSANNTFIFAEPWDEDENTEHLEYLTANHKSVIFGDGRDSKFMEHVANGSYEENPFFSRNRHDVWEEKTEDDNSPDSE